MSPPPFFYKDVWSNPLRFFERFSFHGEDADGDDEERAQRQRL